MVLFCLNQEKKQRTCCNTAFFINFQPPSQPPKELGLNNVPASVLMPHLQNLFQQTSIQQVRHQCMVGMQDPCPPPTQIHTQEKIQNKNKKRNVKFRIN